MIVVTGAAGQLGRLVIAELLHKLPPSEIVAAVRNPAKAQDLAARGVDVRLADYDKPDTLAGIDDDVEFGKERNIQRHAEIANIDEGHGRSQVLPAKTRRPGHAAIVGCSCGSAASYTNAGANDQMLDAALPRGQTRKRFTERSLVSPANAFAGR